jgi:hypothetical protein
MLELPDVLQLGYESLRIFTLTSKKSSIHLFALYCRNTALRTSTPRRDQLVIYGQYCPGIFPNGLSRTMKISITITCSQGEI